MKLVQQSKLFFKEGKSDKVYEVELLELSSNEYIVNFRYGRRGGNMKEGTKTPSAVSKEKAEALFSSLENEKRKKGYQSETEVFIELPSLETIEPKSIEGVILQRLQDAVEGKNTFKTEWKTSRVIWKAAELNIQEAIPFIIKLTTKGDDLQSYAGLWALNKFKVENAVSVFQAFAFQLKQKEYLRNIANEGLLSILKDEELSNHLNLIFEKLPSEIKILIENRNYKALKTELLRDSEKKEITYFADLYLVAKVYENIIPCINEALKIWEFKPPFFKFIRSIYKLAQVRKDFQTIGTLSYRFEKEYQMFNRTSYSYDGYEQYIQQLDTYVTVEKELKNKNSRLAFSQFTKTYFQKNAVKYLENAAENLETKEYLKLAVSTLLQYSEEDYKPSKKDYCPNYGIYNYQTKKYRYTVYDYPECCNLLLLNKILFGNDSKRILEKNIYVERKRYFESSSWYFDKNNSVEIFPNENTKNVENNSEKTTKNSVLGGFINAFKDVVGGKKEEKENKEGKTKKAEIPNAIPSTIPSTIPSRLELHPEYWDSMPEAYVQLLIQAKMNKVHDFAFNNLKAHPKYEEFLNKFDSNIVSQFLNSQFNSPAKLGFEILKRRGDEFKSDKKFVAQIIDSQNEDVRNWAKNLILNDKEFYLGDFDFTMILIHNSKKENIDWINELIQNHRFIQSRTQALLGKLVSGLLQFRESEENDGNDDRAKLAELIIKRIRIFAQNELANMSWNIIEQLILSPFKTNILLASDIMYKKSDKIDLEEIPLSLVELFLNNEIDKVRENGIHILEKYPNNLLVKNIQFILNQRNTKYQDVFEKILNCLKSIIYENFSTGEIILSNLNYSLIRKETFEGSHVLIREFIEKDLKTYWETNIKIKDIMNLIHSQYRQSQLLGYEMLKGHKNLSEFTLRQIISFGSHDILALRQWCWKYFKENVERIRLEKSKALNLLDSKWEDTRVYAFHFFKTEFMENDWDTDTLISIVDSIRPDVENFGKDLIKQYFNPETALEYLAKLSEHPSVNVQAFITNYLSLYASGNIEIIKELNFYFRSVLTRVNKSRVAKNRILSFLDKEALKSEEAASFIFPILDDISAQSSIQDKANCIDILTKIRANYPHLDMHLTIKN